MKALVVDDEKDSRLLLSKILAANGYESVEASNGIEALKILTEVRPDIIISDILMPEMDGFQFCREIKRNESLRDIPFVFYTASYKDAPDEELAMDVGANAFIRKPEDPKVLVELIGKLLGDYRTGKLEPAKPAITDEKEYLSIYSGRLLNKLEDKVLELENANKKLEMACEELKTVDHLKDNILSNVTHELKTPLVHALGYLELAMDERDEVKRSEFLKKCMSALNREDLVISRLLETAYSGRGLLKPDAGNIDIVKLIESTIEDMSPKAEAFNVKISFSHNEGLVVHGKRNQIRHALSNLLDNAIKFNKRGGEVEITAERTDGLVEVCFRDTGIGIPHDKLEKVFDKIYQVDSDTTRKYGGVGIGLAITKYIIETHNGKIRVKSSVGDGSTFCFTIPLGERR